MRRTPLFEQHKAANARLIDFAGWEMPVQYQGVIEETRVVRAAAGMFDVSHMGRVWVRGERAFDFWQNLTSNDVGKLADSNAQYSLMLHPNGGTVDDIILYRLSQTEFLVVWNSSNRDKDLNWARKNAKEFGDLEFDDQSDETAMIAVQGPTALGVVDLISDRALSMGDRFSVQHAKVAGVDAIACRTGYTGEDGFELIVPADGAATVWNALHENGVVPCGLAARDALRVEAGLPLYGHELGDDINPIEAGLGWVVSKTKTFIGSDAIAKVREAGVKRKLVGVEMESRMVPRIGYPILLQGEVIGEVTSGVYSPQLDKGIAFAFVDAPRSEPGQAIEVEVRGKPQPALLTTKRFLKDRK